MAIEYAGARPRHRRRRVEIAGARDVVRTFDWILFGAVLALVGYGLHLVAGITSDDVPGNPDFYVLRQATYAAVGIVGMLGLALVDPDVFRRFWRPLYGASVLMLLLVLPFGSEVRGSQRWISFGSFQFQPSEAVKLLLVLAVAGFLADRFRRISEWRVVLTAIALATAPALLVFFQPDIGTSLVYGAALAAMLFIAGARWLHVGVLLVVAALLPPTIIWFLPAVGADILEPYQRARLTAFVDPDSDPQRTTYNVEQSITAIGAGGLRGRGVENASQTNLDYLPEHATDFAFASLAEQRGFVGAAILLLLYLLVVWRGLRVTTLAGDAYSAIVAGAIVFALLFQIFINVGMTMGIAPVTGIPLPFVSVGGSSLVTNLFAIGVLQAIHARGRRR
jgi:rod shape determining protein RodA